MDIWNQKRTISSKSPRFLAGEVPNSEALNAALCQHPYPDTPAFPFPPSVRSFACLPSTNQTLWELLDRGAGAGTVAIARQQSAGKGRQGKSWISRPGGLYLSAALAPDGDAATSPMIALAIAWGIATRLRSLEIPVALKWPNDLILAGRKLGGILTETRVRSGKIVYAVVGVGLNWKNSVPETAIALHDLWRGWGTHPYPIGSLETLAAIVLGGIARGFCFLQARGAKVLAEACGALLTHLGQPVSIDGRWGTVVGIDESGALRVRFSELGGDEICLESGAIALGYPAMPS